MVDDELSDEAMRRDGGDFFAAATFPVGMSFLTLVNGGWGGNVTGLSSLDGPTPRRTRPAGSSSTRTRPGTGSASGSPRRGIRWRIDAKEVVAVNDREQHVGTRIETRGNQPLGFATWETGGALRNDRDPEAHARRGRRHQRLRQVSRDSEPRRDPRPIQPRRLDWQDKGAESADDYEVERPARDTSIGASAMTLTPEARCAIPRNNARHPGPESRLDALKHGRRTRSSPCPAGPSSSSGPDSATGTTPADPGAPRRSTRSTRAREPLDADGFRRLSNRRSG